MRGPAARTVPRDPDLVAAMWSFPTPLLDVGCAFLLCHFADCRRAEVTFRLPVHRALAKRTMVNSEAMPMLLQDRIDLVGCSLPLRKQCVFRPIVTAHFGKP